jgi:hypothetical protein
MSVRFLLSFSLAAAFLATTAFAQLGGETGWAPYPVKFDVQWPTNAARAERYWEIHDVYHCRVYNTDGAFAAGNTTRPRTEQRFVPDDKGGEIQYQSMELAPADENGYCIFQIHTGDVQSHEYGATAFMLFWFSKDGGQCMITAGRSWQEICGTSGFNSMWTRTWITAPSKSGSTSS